MFIATRLRVFEMEMLRERESRFVHVTAITMAESSNDIAKTAKSLSKRLQVLLFDRELIPSYG